MRIDGSHLIRGTRQQVWDALHDPGVLVATIPGCRELREDAPDSYTAQVEVGIASLTGVYDGQVVLREQKEPMEYVLAASGQGGPGTIDATVIIRLAEADGGTIVEYDADAVIGGAVAGVGQRVISGVAKRSAAQFFTAVDAHVLGADTTAVVASDSQPVSVDAVGVTDASTSRAAGRRVFRPPTPQQSGTTGIRELLLAAAFGGAIALAGVLVGSRLRR